MAERSLCVCMCVPKNQSCVYSRRFATIFRVENTAVCPSHVSFSALIFSLRDVFFEIIADLAIIYGSAFEVNLVRSRIQKILPGVESVSFREMTIENSGQVHRLV